MFRLLAHVVIVLGLTVLTQVGGVAWALSRPFHRSLIVFVVLYAALSFGSTLAAPSFGRVALSCGDEDALQVQSWMYCALNRNFVSPELKAVLTETAEAMNQRFPGTVTLVLDANFPFFDGFPLLPHLSHDDGEKVDLAFFYRDQMGYLPGETRSPIGYFAFEQGSTDCPEAWPTLRWDFGPLQAHWRDLSLDVERNRAVLISLSDNTRVEKIFVEPHVARFLDVSHPKIRFQGCRAARHDDHIHFQIRP